ncbi:MAG: ATP-binding protein, partial [Gemmatimonadaceae bacterium]|nr:ATP-binding protein [Gemmatimonadaceae bacterium]
MSLRDPSAVTSLWTPYGLRGDPYFRQALDPTTNRDEARPASLLVGRSAEMAQVKTLIESSENSRSVIQGEAGVGKTSFVSALKTQLQSAHVLTHAEPIRVQPTMTASGFIAEVLKVVLQMRATERLHAGILSNVRNRVSAGIRDTEGEFWTRLTRVILGEDNTSIGVTAGVVGVQGQKGRIAAEAVDVSLFDELKTAFRYMAKNGTRRTLIHVNNMESLTPTDAAAAATLIHSLRDAFQFDHAHWLFVGTSDIEQRLFRVHPQVSQIFDRPLTLGPLRPDEVAELLTRRYRHLQLGVHANPPIAPEVASAIYARFAGELRGFLGLLGAAVRAWAPLHPGQPMTANDIIATAGPVARQELIEKIGENDTERLHEITDGWPFDAEFRVADIQRRCS